MIWTIWYHLTYHTGNIKWFISYGKYKIGPYRMNYLIFSIWYSPYDMVNIVWTILYGLYKTVQIVRSIRNCQFCLDAQEQSLLYLRTQLQSKNTSGLFQRRNRPYKNCFVRHRLISRHNNYWPAMIRIFVKIKPIFLYV